MPAFKKRIETQARRRSELSQLAPSRAGRVACQADDETTARCEHVAHFRMQLSNCVSRHISCRFERKRLSVDAQTPRDVEFGTVVAARDTVQFRRGWRDGRKSARVTPNVPVHKTKDENAIDRASHDDILLSTPEY
jgi:hypothetical protein